MGSKYAVSLVCGVWAMLAAGCGGDTAGTPTSGPGGSSDANIDATLDRLGNALASVCGCVPAGSQRQSCLDEIESEQLTLNECQRQVLATPEGQRLVNCVGGVIDQVSSCLNAAGCSQSAMEACLESLEEDMDTCESKSSVSGQMAACDPD